MNNWRSALRNATDTLFIPFRAATSKTAQRAYLGTALFTLSTFFLLGISTVAFFLFYNLYVPEIGLQRTIHLQFGEGHPHGSAHLSSSLASLQPYDISLLLNLPRTPANLATGNFMLDLALLAPTSPTISTADILSSSFNTANTSTSVLGQSRRPAILTYASSLVEHAYKLSNLPWYMIGWKKESEALEVSMFEGVQFAKGWRNIPDQVKIVIEADEKMQFYEVSVKIRARFQGLRWILYNHRISSFVIFTTAFFSVSLCSSAVIYLIFTLWLTPNTKVERSPEPAVKAESQLNSDAKPFNPLSISDLSDTARSFPARGRQGPLHFVSRSEAEAIKQEDEDDFDAGGAQQLVAEADDEDEEYAESSAFKDSGIGTGIDDERRGSARRRKSSRGQ